MVASRGQLSPVRLSKVSFFRLQLQQLMEIRALPQGGEVLVLLHVGGVLVALGGGVLEQGQRVIGTLFGEPARVGGNRGDSNRYLSHSNDLWKNTLFGQRLSILPERSP